MDVGLGGAGDVIVTPDLAPALARDGNGNGAVGEGIVVWS